MFSSVFLLCRIETVTSLAGSNPVCCCFADVEPAPLRLLQSLCADSELSSDGRCGVASPQHTQDPGYHSLSICPTNADVVRPCALSRSCDRMKHVFISSWWHGSLYQVMTACSCTISTHLPWVTESLLGRKKIFLKYNLIYVSDCRKWVTVSYYVGGSLCICWYGSISFVLIFFIW